MRVAFLVEELGRSGGMAVIRAHARALIARGDACELVVTGRATALPATDDGVPVRRLGDAAGEGWDVAIATWWTTADALWEVDARRRALFMQNLEHRFYRSEDIPEILGAVGVLDLPVDFLVIASHMRDLLARLRPDARVHLVPDGIDKAVFRPAETDGRADGDPLRVLVEGQPTLWHKGVAEAVAAARAMRAPATVTVAAHDPATAGDLGADRVVGGLDAHGMAALYGEHDVLLKLSRFEGLGLPPLEAMHVGRPVVMTPFTGSEDYAKHGVNALVVPFDDQAAATAALDRLATDAALYASLRAGALATAEAWPDAGSASRRFAAALEDLLATEPPDPAPALRAMMRGRRRVLEQSREALRRAQARLELEGSGAAEWRAAYRHADARNAEYDAWTQELKRRIDELQSRPGFRIEERLRRLAQR